MAIRRQLQCGAFEQAVVCCIEGIAPMHQETVVPHHHITDLPFVGINKVGLCRVGNQFVKQCLALRIAPPFDTCGGRRVKIQCRVAGLGMTVNERVRDRWRFATQFSRHFRFVIVSGLSD